MLKSDAIIAGVHCFPDDPPELLARKALRVNLSDLAAKGAKPYGFLLYLALNGNIDDAWLSSFTDGLGTDAEIYGCALLGGDTDQTPGPLTISIAMIGAVPAGGMVRRHGAKPGDKVMVTGSIGDASLGLQLRRSAPWKITFNEREQLLSRYLLPQPRVALTDALRTHASAAIDISDGLVGDLAKLCRVSGVAADVEVAKVPLSTVARSLIADDPSRIEIVLTGGDDYEILCTVPPHRAEDFRIAAAAEKIPLTEMGIISEGEGARFRDTSGTELRFSKPAYSHF